MKITVGQLRRLVREAVGEMGGWDPKADYDVNKWGELQRMLPDMGDELAAALEKIKAEAPMIRAGRSKYDVRSLAREVALDLGVSPTGNEYLAIYNTVEHLSRQQPTGGYAHVPTGDAFPRGRGGPGDTRGT